MVLTQNHIDPLYSNHFLDIKVRLLNFGSRVMKLLRISTLKTGIVNSINQDLGKVFIMTEGLKSYVTELNNINSKAEYPYAQKSFRRFRKHARRLADVNYMRNPDTRELCGAIISNFYEIEFILRQKAFSDTDIDRRDSELKEKASIISINSAFELNGELQSKGFSISK